MFSRIISLCTGQGGGRLDPETEGTHVWKKDEIGIFSRSDSSEYSWLMKFLKSKNLSVTPFYIANYKFQTFMQDVSGCTFGILYHTKNRGRINVTNVTSSLYDKELKYLHDTLGKDNVLVVIDDLEDSTDQEKDRILKEQHSIKEWAQDLFIFCQEEKKLDPHFILYPETKLTQLEVMITGSTGQFTPASPLSSRQCVSAPGGSTEQFTPASPLSSRQCVSAPGGSIEQCTPASPGSSRQCFSFLPGLTEHHPSASNGFTAHIPPSSKSFSTCQTQISESGHNPRKKQSTEQQGLMTFPYNLRPVPLVGIFSITADTEYSWLKYLLRNKFRNVKSFHISFAGFHQFLNDLSQCSHGILYHTKNRGRINVTDVTDSLYDRHLESMSATLGKNRVIVVLDDLEDNSDEVKRTILREQPKIYKLARDLFLVKQGTNQQKMFYFEHKRKPDFS